MTASNSVRLVGAARTAASAITSWSAAPAARRRARPLRFGSTASFWGGRMVTVIFGNQDFLICVRRR